MRTIAINKVIYVCLFFIVKGRERVSKIMMLRAS